MPKNQWPACVVGTLIIGDPPHNPESRFKREAAIWVDHNNTCRRSVGVIFDPVIYQTVDGGFLLGGVQLKADGPTIHEHQQLWLVRPRSL